MDFFEFVIPRMGRRADVILTIEGVVFVLEFKVGSELFSSQDLRQVESYALDLKNFHQGSHDAPIVPILVATSCPRSEVLVKPASYCVFEPIETNGWNLADIISRACGAISAVLIDGWAWSGERYKPTPTIVEAAQALYANHDVEDIARNDAGAANLAITSVRVQEIIHQSRLLKRKSICFVTGVPGAGKTLVGLNIATSSPKGEDAVFLSGNGPLVAVLREALARDEVTRTPGLKKLHAAQRVKAFVQNIHHFRDDAISSVNAPTERVVIFDEAQRAWDRRHTEKFMTNKRNMTEFDMSEPEFLISIMDRHDEWCVIVALIGGGQEINSGEIGLEGWRDALVDRYPHWDVYYSDRLNHGEYVGSDVDFTGLPNEVNQAENALHLAASMRSFRSEMLSDMVHFMVEGKAEEACKIHSVFADRFPIRVTRNLDVAKNWVRHQVRGLESAGLIASSAAIRLKPHAINVKNPLDAPVWFLNEPEDIRSSDFMEDVATEFEIQGLELDWTVVAWDADFRHNGSAFEYWDFKGTKWSRRNQEQSRRYLANSYRVLLTRARQGMVIFIPEGDVIDSTRRREWYDGTYQYLLNCGIPVVE